MRIDRIWAGRKFTVLIILIFSLFRPLIYGQQVRSDKLTLLFIGDIMGHSEQIWSAENRENHTYSYDTVFSFIRPAISEADLAIANLEVTLAGPPYSGFPGFNSPAALATACKNAGIDCLVTANNHSADRRSKGINGTIIALDSLGIEHTGTFSSPEDRIRKYPLILKKKGFSIALLNYTYGTNDIKVNKPVIVNLIDRDMIEKDLLFAHKLNPDITIVYLHWGNEFETIPSKAQYELADFLFEKGADIIIGSHPHVLQRMTWTKSANGEMDKVAVYSLGNFVSNQRKKRTEGGAMARIELTRAGSSVMITSADYYLTWVYTPIENYRKRFFVLPCSEFENKASFFPDTVYFKRMKQFMSDSRRLLYSQNKNIFEMIYNGSSWLLNY